MNSKATSKRVEFSPFMVYLPFFRDGKKVDLYVCLLCDHVANSSWETKVLKTKVSNTKNSKDSVYVRSLVRRDYAKNHVEENDGHEKSVQNVYEELLKISNLSPADLNFVISTETKIIVLLYVISIFWIKLKLDVTFENARIEMLVSHMIRDIWKVAVSVHGRGLNNELNDPNNQTGSSAIWRWSTIFTTLTSKKTKDCFGLNFPPHLNQLLLTQSYNQSFTYDENNALSNGTALHNSSSTPFGKHYSLTIGALIKELGGQAESGTDAGYAREGSHETRFHNIYEIVGKEFDEYLKKLLQDSPCNPNDIKNTEINFTDDKKNQDNDAVSLDSCSTSVDYHYDGNPRTHKNESGEEILPYGLKQDGYLTESNIPKAQLVLLNNSA